MKAKTLKKSLSAKRFWLLCLFVIGLSSGGIGQTNGEKKVQQIVLKGFVFDEKKQPLPGVTVRIAGTSMGTATDMDGWFQVAFPQEKGQLTFSFIGYKAQTLDVARSMANDTLRVFLKEDSQGLEEIVVTGLGDRKKDSYTGKAITVNKEQLMTMNNRNVFAAMQHFDPSLRIQKSAFGSDPNNIPEINIRGKSSIGMDKSIETERLKNSQRTDWRNNPNLPVFIMDGFEVSAEKVYDLDMNRVEMMTILKDAAATAIYGSRAANGVIVITTVAPKPGEMTINYNFNGSLTLPDLSDYNMCNAEEKLELEKLAGVYTASSAASQASSDQAYYLVLNDILSGVNTDWLSQPLRNPFNHKHSLSIDGGVESIRYQISMNYNTDAGAMKGSYRNRYGLGLKLDYRYKTMQLTNNVTYSGVRAEDSPFGSFSTYVTQLPYKKIYDSEGNLLEYFENTQSKNPLYEPMMLASYKGRNRVDELQNNLSVRWDILPDNLLRFMAQVGVTKYSSKTESFSDPAAASKYTSYDQRGSLSQSYSDNFSWDMNARLELFKEFEGGHAFSMNLGVNAQEKKSDSHSMTFQGFQMEDFNSPAFAQDQPNKTNVTESTSRLIGFLGVLSYSYNNIYLFDGTIRVDGSSAFGSDKKFAPFYSFGFGVNVHNMEWFKENMPYVSRLKPRISYGITGNVNFPAYAATTTYEIDPDYWYYTGPGASLMGLGNPKLQWETTHNLDYGIELGLLNDRFVITADYYIKETKDLIDQITIRPSSGFTEYRANSGSMENRGFELDLSAQVIRRDDFSLTLTANMAGNKNKLKELGEAAKAYNESINNAYQSGSYSSYAPFTRYYEGASVTAIYAVKSAGIDPANGKEKYYKKDGSMTYTWDANDQIVAGDEQPDAQGAFHVNLRYKGLSVTAGFMYEFGGQLYNTTLLNKVEHGNISGANVDKRMLTDRWKKPGDLTPYKNASNLSGAGTTRPTTRFVQDNNTLEFSNLEIRYDFPKELISKWRLKTLYLSMNMNDVARWSSIQIERGTEYPFAWNYNFSLGVSF